MTDAVTIEGGFAEVGAGSWLMAGRQPAAFFGDIRRRRRKGWIVRDRSRLDLMDTSGLAKCADATRPFLTFIPCAAEISAVTDKILVAPASARLDAEFLKAIPMSTRGAMCITRFGSADVSVSEGENDGQTQKTAARQTSCFVVMATASRTTRVAVADGDTLSVRPESLVAWTGGRPTGFVRKLGIWDVLLPRWPRDLLLHFHGPSIVWLEGSRQTHKLPSRQFGRRPYGV